MNPMKESWSVLKGDEEFRIQQGHMDADDRRKFMTRDYNPDDFPTSVPRAIQQGRPVNVHRTPSYPIQQGHGVRYGGNNPVARMEGEDTEDLRPGSEHDAQGVVGNRGRYGLRGNKGRSSNLPTTAKIGEDSGEDDSGARASSMGGYIEDIGQQVQAMPRPSPGRVDDLSRQDEGGMRAQTSGFQSKPYGRFMNRQPKMGPGGMPQNMGAFDEVNPQFKPTLRGMGVKTGMPMAIHDAWSFMKDKKKCCPKCEPKGSTCEKMGCGS
jgi:hypothetical protein